MCICTLLKCTGFIDQDFGFYSQGRGRCLKDTWVSSGEQIYISEAYSGFTVENALVRTVVATQVRNGGNGRNGRFEICVEVELRELEGEGGIKNVPQVCGYGTE